MIYNNALPHRYIKPNVFTHAATLLSQHGRATRDPDENGPKTEFPVVGTRAGTAPPCDRCAVVEARAILTSAGTRFNDTRFDGYNNIVVRFSEATTIKI